MVGNTYERKNRTALLQDSLLSNATARFPQRGGRGGSAASPRKKIARRATASKFQNFRPSRGGSAASHTVNLRSPERREGAQTRLSTPPHLALPEHPGEGEGHVHTVRQPEGSDVEPRVNHDDCSEDAPVERVAVHTCDVFYVFCLTCVGFVYVVPSRSTLTLISRTFSGL